MVSVLYLLTVCHRFQQELRRGFIIEKRREVRLRMLLLKYYALGTTSTWWLKVQGILLTVQISGTHITKPCGTHFILSRGAIWAPNHGAQMGFQVGPIKKNRMGPIWANQVGPISFCCVSKWVPCHGTQMGFKVGPIQKNVWDPY